MKVLPFFAGLSYGQYLMTNPRKTLENEIADAEAKVSSKTFSSVAFLIYEYRDHGEISMVQIRVLFFSTILKNKKKIIVPKL